MNYHVRFHPPNAQQATKEHVVESHNWTGGLKPSSCFRRNAPCSICNELIFYGSNVKSLTAGRHALLHSLLIIDAARQFHANFLARSWLLMIFLVLVVLVKQCILSRVGSTSPQDSLAWNSLLRQIDQFLVLWRVIFAISLSRCEFTKQISNDNNNN